MDDAAASRACRAGHVDAFRHFVDRYQGRALAHARLLTRNEADAADAAQDAFLDAFRALAAFDASRPFYAWFYVLLRNRCFKQRARRKGGQLPSSFTSGPRDRSWDEACHQRTVLQVRRWSSDAERPSNPLPILVARPMASIVLAAI
jgi:RNA polymerase sigma-70 factor (ECF subfamily)